MPGMFSTFGTIVILKRLSHQVNDGDQKSIHPSFAAAVTFTATLMFAAASLDRRSSKRFCRRCNAIAAAPLTASPSNAASAVTQSPPLSGVTPPPAYFQGWLHLVEVFHRSPLTFLHQFFFFFLFPSPILNSIMLRIANVTRSLFRQVVDCCVAVSLEFDFLDRRLGGQFL